MQENGQQTYLAFRWTPAGYELHEESGELPGSLDGLPVVLCTVHSQVAPVWAALRDVRAAYVQVHGGALPLQLSETVASLASITSASNATEKSSSNSDAARRTSAVA